MLLKVGIIKIYAVSLECFHEYTVHVPYRGDLLTFCSFATVDRQSLLNNLNENIQNVKRSDL